MTIAAAPGLENRLRREIKGDVWFDRLTRGRYATDASHYQMMPLGVVAPRSVAEAERAIAQATADGGKVLTGGRRLTNGEFSHGYFVEPTVIDVRPRSWGSL